MKFLAKVSVDIDIRTGGISFALPDFGLTSKDTIIEDHVWQTCKDDLVHGCETGNGRNRLSPSDDYDTGYYKDKSRERTEVK